MASKPVSADEIAELDRLSRAQLEAADAGDFEEVRLLVGTRQHLLDTMRGRAVRAGDLERVMASDAGTVAALRVQIERLEQALARLSEGERVLSGYALRSAVSPAFLDHVR